MIKFDHLKETILVQPSLVEVDGSVVPERYMLPFWLVYKDGPEFKAKIHNLRDKPFGSIDELWDYAKGYFSFEYVEVTEPVFSDNLEMPGTKSIVGEITKPVKLIAVAPHSGIPESYKDILKYAFEVPSPADETENNPGAAIQPEPESPAETVGVGTE